MSPPVSWKILFFSSLVTLAYSQNCKWLRHTQEYLNKRILQTFNQMSHPPTASEFCSESEAELPNIEELYNISQVEEAAIAVREVAIQTIWFYERHHERLKCLVKAWERMQDHLLYLTKQLDDCIPEGAENPNFKQKISEYFNLLEKNLKKQDDACVRTAIQISIKRNLQLAAQLSSRMRRRHLMNISSTV